MKSPKLSLHEGEIERLLQALEVVFRGDLFEGEIGQRGERADLGTHHNGASS
jgi:hypothetical protein